MAILFNNDKVGLEVTEDSFYATGLRLKKKWTIGAKACAYFPDKDIIVCVPPKCGSSSWYKAIDGEIYYRAKSYEPYTVHIIRHPIERFKSVWKNKCRDGHRICRGEHGRKVASLSVDQFLDLIEAGYWNHHWGKQSDYCCAGADELVPLEYFSDWAKQYGWDLPALNQTAGDIELTDTQYRRVAEYYIDDIRLYERGLREYNK